MEKRRRVNGAKEKAKVAVDAIREQNTSCVFSVPFKVHQTQIEAWKKKLIEEASSVFERGYSNSRDQEFLQREAELFEELGRLKMELECLNESCPVRLNRCDL
jgi:putative transposase